MNVVADNQVQKKKENLQLTLTWCCPSPLCSLFWKLLNWKKNFGQIHRKNKIFKDIQAGNFILQMFYCLTCAKNRCSIFVFLNNRHGAPLNCKNIDLLSCWIEDTLWTAGRLNTSVVTPVLIDAEKHLKPKDYRYSDIVGRMRWTWTSSQIHVDSAEIICSPIILFIFLYLFMFFWCFFRI